MPHSQPTHHVKVPKKPRQWPAFLAVTKYATIAALRNPATLAFGFIFPLVFISIFGLFGNSHITLKMGIPDGTPNNPVTPALEHIDAFKIQHGSMDDLQKQLSIGKIDGVLEVTTTQPAGYGVKLYTSNANPQTAGTEASLISGLVDKANLQIAHINPVLTFDQAKVQGRESRYIDFALPGMIGFAMLGTALFGTVIGLIALKKTLVLKRLFATPTRPLTFLAAQGLSRLFFALAQTLVIIGVGVVAFHFTLPYGWITLLEVLLISALGLIAFLGFGYFMAGFANDENSAGPLLNLITLPQFLLSGVFFSTDTFPSWVQPIAHNLPLSYFNDAIRKVTTESGHLSDTWPYLLGLLAWGAVMYVLASITFRWE